MKSENYVFNNNHLHNIKNIFEEKSGVQLTKKKIGFAHRKLVAATLAAVLCLSIGTPALAANVPAVYELMYQVSPSVAQFFMPVQKSSESNGIKMEVVSAYIHDDTAEIYVTMQDLTGNRIDSTTDLNDSYSINRSFGGSASCQRVGYDKKTNTATFLISITEWGNQKITGDKITFSVKQFISDKKSYADIKIPIDLSLVDTDISTKSVDSTGGSGKNYEKCIVDGKTTALTPSQAMDGFPVDGIELTGIGYIDGKLHIQTAAYDNLDKDNHGTFYLKDADGNRVDLDYDFHFLNQFQQPGRIDYYECVFDILQEQLGKYALYGDFVTSGMHTEGNWRVTFPLEEAE